MMTSSEVGYIAAMLQLAVQAKELDQGLTEKLVIEANRVMDSSISPVIDAKVVKFSKD